MSNIAGKLLKYEWLFLKLQKWSFNEKTWKNTKNSLTVKGLVGILLFVQKLSLNNFWQK